ncbi:MAG: hypothetical protein JXB42_02370 [Deltaproteobacteria bacterium]|nr:hypothetical protein [Deltaproteobacteria bacterium]
MKRPSYKELYNKIAKAKEAISKERIYLLDQDVIIIHALELGYEVKEIDTVLLEHLEDITPQHYVGSYPPQKSYEEGILNHDLFAFKVVSKRFGCDVYIKYVLKDENVWLVSFHQDRKKEQENEKS